MIRTTRKEIRRVVREELARLREACGPKSQEEAELAEMDAVLGELENLGEAEDGRVVSKKYKGKTYKGPASMKGKSWEQKVKMAKAAGAKDPEAMAAAATIAHKGKPASKD